MLTHPPDDYDLGELLITDDYDLGELLITNDYDLGTLSEVPMMMRRSASGRL